MNLYIVNNHIIPAMWET